MKTLGAIILPFVLLSAHVTAEEKPAMKQGHMDHANMDHAAHMAQMKKANAANQHTAAPAVPTEAGQAGFAAIAEIVEMLSANPDTDWSTVNITALRDHLVDMDRLVNGAVVEEQSVEQGMRFNVTGRGEVLRAIKNMVPAHASMLNQMPEYATQTESIENGVALTVTSDSEATQMKIKGLGFFGLMASGSHHQPHHFGMATGKMIH